MIQHKKTKISNLLFYLALPFLLIFPSILIFGTPNITTIGNNSEVRINTSVGTLTRNYYPITLNNNTAPLLWSMLDNLSVNNMRVAFFNGTEWILVPFQLDEKGYVRTLIYTAGFQADFTLINGPVEEADLCNYGKYQAIKRYLGKDIDAQPGEDYKEQTKYQCELGFWDTIRAENWTNDPDFAPPSEPIYNETIDLPQNPHCIDYDDELYFYAYNGDQVELSNWWNEEKYPNRFEIEINDPVDGGQAWMYLYYNKDKSIPVNEDHYFIPTTGPYAGVDYINWNPSSLTASGLNYDYSYNLSNVDISSIDINSTPIIDEEDKQYISTGFNAFLNYLIINYNINANNEIWKEGKWNDIYYDEIKSYIGYGITMDLDLSGIESFRGQDSDLTNAHDYDGYYDDKTHGNIDDSSKSYIIPPFINFPNIVKADSADHDGNTSEIVPFARGKLNTTGVDGEAAIDGPCRVIINKYNVRVTGFNIDSPVHYEEFYLITNLESWFSANMMGDFENQISLNFTFGESELDFQYQVFIHYAYFFGQQYSSEFRSNPSSYVMFGQAPMGENGLPILPSCYEGIGKIWPLKCKPDGLQDSDEYLIGDGPVFGKYDNEPINPSSETNPLSDWVYTHNPNAGGLLTYIPYQEFKQLFSGGSEGKADLSAYWADGDSTEFSIYGNDANINGATEPFEKILIFSNLEGSNDVITNLNCKREYARMKMKLSDNLIVANQKYIDLIPNIDFKADKTDVLIGETITFTLSGILGNEPLKYLWNFGDGKISTMANPIHEYLATGNYTVTITVSDKDEQSDTMTKIDYIIVKNESNQDFTPILPPNIGEYILILAIILSGGVAITVVVFYTGKVRSKRKRYGYIHENPSKNKK